MGRLRAAVRGARVPRARHRAAQPIPRHRRVLAGTQAGLLGAIFSVAIGISGRTVAPNTNIRGDLTDSVLRLVIGAISGGTIELFYTTGIVPTLRTAAGELSSGSATVVPLLGIIAGFVERLVPSMLETQGKTFGGTAPEQGQPISAPRLPVSDARPVPLVEPRTIEAKP